MRFAFLRRATLGTSEKAGGKSLYVRQGTWPQLAFLFINLCEHLVLVEKKKLCPHLQKLFPSVLSQTEQTDLITDSSTHGWSFHALMTKVQGTFDVNHQYCT